MKRRESSTCNRPSLRTHRLTHLLNSTSRETYNTVDEVLCHRNYDQTGGEWLLVIPRQLGYDIMEAYHDHPTAGHLGVFKTFGRIRQFFWKSMYGNIARYISSCTRCQHHNNAPRSGPAPLQTFKLPS